MECVAKQIGELWMAKQGKLRMAKQWLVQRLAKQRQQRMERFVSFSHHKSYKYLSLPKSISIKFNFKFSCQFTNKLFDFSSLILQRGQAAQDGGKRSNTLRLNTQSSKCHNNKQSTIHFLINKRTTSKQTSLTK